MFQKGQEVSLQLNYGIKLISMWYAQANSTWKQLRRSAESQKGKWVEIKEVMEFINFGVC